MPAAVLLGLAITGGGFDAIYLPAILINAAILWAFARTLAPGRTPLITLFARLIDGELDAETERYTRRATLWWALFVGLLLVENIALALWAPRQVWSAFAHFINYFLLGGFFLVEYLLRRHYLPARTGTGFIAFARKLSHIDVRGIMRRGA